MTNNIIVNRLTEPEMQVIPEKIIKAGNKKISDYVGVVDMPAGFTCPRDCACNAKGVCYAQSGNYLRFTDIVKGSWHNLYFFMTDPDGFFKAIQSELAEAEKLRPWRFFRWHVTGDIVNAEYFKGMVETARKFKNIKFMAYTKKYSIVNAWIAENGKLPANLTIIFSMWGAYGIGCNPYNLPVAYVEGVGGDEYISKSATPCSGKCLECGFKCWNLKKRQSVVFHKH